jgi:signal peptidase I
MGVGMDDVAFHRVGPFLIIRTFLVEAFRIPTGSMESTLQVGDFLLVNKAVYGARIPLRARELLPPSPERGDVVVFLPPYEPAGNNIEATPWPTRDDRGPIVAFAADPLSIDTQSIPCPDAQRDGSPVSGGAAPAMSCNDVSGLA